MTVSINTASAKITVTNNAVPRVFIGERSVFCHLTHGFHSGRDLQQNDSAFSATGRVHVLFSRPTDTLDGWEFGFVQLARANDISFYYAGRKRDRGSIVIRAHRLPAMTHNPVLDGHREHSPWTTPQLGRFTPALPRVSTWTHDHPTVMVGRTLSNSTTNRKNYLFRIVDSRDFWTVFRALSPARIVTDLAHYRFRLRHDVTFAWRDNDPVVTSMNSTFYISEQMTGAPSEARLQALLADPYSPGPHFNDVVTGAILASRDSGQTPNRTDNAAWFANVPRGFYQ